MKNTPPFVQLRQREHKNLSNLSRWWKIGVIGLWLAVRAIVATGSQKPNNLTQTNERTFISLVKDDRLLGRVFDLSRCKSSKYVSYVRFDRLIGRMR